MEVGLHLWREAIQWRGHSSVNQTSQTPARHSVMQEDTSLDEVLGWLRSTRQAGTWRATTFGVETLGSLVVEPLYSVLHPSVLRYSQQTLQL